MPTKVRPYLFYDTAVSLCTTCYRRIDAKLVFENENGPSSQSSPFSERSDQTKLVGHPRTIHTLQELSQTLPSSQTFHAYSH
jgi:hypothetical protein